MKKKHLPKKKTSALTSVDAKNIDALYQKASAYIDQARQTIHQTIDTEMVKAYWCISAMSDEGGLRWQRRSRSMIHHFCVR